MRTTAIYGGARGEKERGAWRGFGIKTCHPRCSRVHLGEFVEKPAQQSIALTIDEYPAMHRPFAQGLKQFSK